jgi:hypothetical protein
MTSAEEVGRILSNADKAVRVLHFTALLAREAGVGPTGMIVVGGSAIEVYTQGGYVSGDIDIVAERQKIRPVLERWGFQTNGRIQYQRDWKIAVDVVDADYHGDRARTRVVETPFGGVQIEALEDSMVRRLVAARFWQQPDDFGLALVLAIEYGDDIDWNYSEALARRELVPDLLIRLRPRAQRASRKAPR